MSDIEPKYLDKRTSERYVKLGLVDEKALEKHLKSLPDVAEKGMAIETIADHFDDPVDLGEDGQE
jgi:hypothetical protein